MNTVTAKFNPGMRKTTTSGSLSQWDYGQILEIEGLDLPDTFEAHFSNQPYDGNAKPCIGEYNQVKIPDEYLENGEPVYVFIFLHSSENDGETEYRIVIPVDKRPRPVKLTPRPSEQSVFAQLLAAMNTAAEKAETEAEAAAAAVDEARLMLLTLGVEAQSIPAEFEATVEKIVDPETEAVTLQFGIPEGRQGEPGERGEVYYPYISDEGLLQWVVISEPQIPESFNIVSAVLDALPRAEEGWF